MSFWITAIVEQRDREILRRAMTTRTGNHNDR